MMAARRSIARRGLRRGLLRFDYLVALVPWLGACSTTVFYNEPGAPNLRFRAMSNGRFLTYTSIQLDIHRVTAQSTDPVHLPEERLSLLAFEFHQHGNIESWTSYKTLLRPRAGQTYEATVNYDAGLYDVEIRETGPNGGRKIEHWSLSDCHRA